MRRYETGRLLLQAGAVNGYDGTMESTVSKLMHLLGQGYTKDEILALLNTSIAGEITIPEE
jgi:L-asparaginase